MIAKSKWHNPGLRKYAPGWNDYREQLAREKGLSVSEIEAAIERNKKYTPMVGMRCEGKTFQADVNIESLNKTQIRKLFSAVIS